MTQERQEQRDHVEQWDPVEQREQQVLAAVTSLVDTLLEDFDVVDLLTRLTEQCTRLLDITAAGLLLADRTRRLHLMAATPTSAQDRDVLQVQVTEGPCRDCYVTGRSLTVSDLSTQRARWPRFVPAAAAAGVVSVHAVPMRASGTVVGALGLFGATDRALGPADQLVGRTLAHVATVAVLQQEASTRAVLPQLHSALNSRVVVEQAKGFLHERLGVPLDVAFDLLRGYAHRTGVHLTTVARRLVSDPSQRPSILAGLAADRD